MPEEMRMMPDPASPTGYSLQPVYRPPTPLEIARGTLNNYADILGSYLTQQAAPRPSQFGRILQGMGYGQTPETVQAQQQRIQNLPLPMENRVRNAITQGVDYAGNFLAQGRAPEIGGAVRSMVEPVAQFPVTAVTDPLRAANQAQQVLDPAYAMARGLTTTKLGAEAGNLGDVAAGVTEMGLAGLSFVPGGAAVKGARAMPPAPIRRPPPIGQPNVLAPPASRGPILNQLADQPELLGGGLGGALGATQGETPEERARNALLGAAGGAVGGRMARGMTPDKTRFGSNLGNVPKPVQKAQAEGYEGADIGEAKEWVRAREKGLDMSQGARMQRAKEQGYDAEIGDYLVKLNPKTKTALNNRMKSVQEAYRIGSALRGDVERYGLDEAIMRAVNRGKIPSSLIAPPPYEATDVQLAIYNGNQQAMLAGARGNPAPKWALGERYGDLPPGGQSTNWAENTPESGVSVYGLFDPKTGDLAKQGDAVSRGFIESGNRPVRRILGIDLGDLGSDGEPLLVKPMVFTNEANIRSVNAAFDPASKESANILAGVGAVGAGAAMTGSIRPPEQKKPPGQRPRG